MPAYKRRKDIRFINPYTFVPISKNERIARSKAQPADADGLHTGVLRCRLYVRTPLGIPDAEREKEYVNGHKEYPFFTYREDGKEVPVIPGSSLRGAVRSIFEAAADSCFSTLREDTGLSRRCGSREAYKPGILRWENGICRLYQAERYILPADPVMNDYTKYTGLPDSVYVKIKQKDGCRTAVTGKGEELRFGDLIEFQPYTKGNAVYKKRGYLVWNGAAGDVNKKAAGEKCSAGKIEGLVYIGETFARKKHGESVFVLKKPVQNLTAEQLERAYNGLLETLEIYRNPAINRSRGHSGYGDFAHAKKETGIPVWYSIKGGRLSLAAASIGRTFYDTSLNELAGQRSPCQNRKELCEACALFGMTGEESMGSRIRFTDAKVMGKYCLKPAALKILGQPRYSYLPFYAKSQSRKGIPDSYDAKDTEIAGRKFYWHNPKAAKDSSIYTAENKNKMNSTMELMMPGAEFCFSIYYDGITGDQLQKLMWCLHFGENEKDGDLCAKLGHGKPLGLGSVKLVIEENAERIFKDGAYKWEREAAPKLLKEPAFKNCRELKKVMDFRGPDQDIPIKYPYICDRNGHDLSDSQKNENARHVWYQKNKDADRNREDLTEILPDIMDEKQALHPFEKIPKG